MSVFKCIKDIVLEDPASWENNLFLTIDIDWACDEVLSFTIDILEKYDAAATWFVTHDTPLLSRLRSNPKFELGIHPNFNFMLSGQNDIQANAEDVVTNMLALVPEAQSVRSHSMTQSSPLLQLFKDKGLIYDCNHYIPEQANITLKPWRLWNGLVKVPYFWEDDLHCAYGSPASIMDLPKRSGLKVFDFHPIHIFLNTENLDRYEKSRPYHHDAHLLREFTCQGKDGSFNRLENLLGAQSCA